MHLPYVVTSDFAALLDYVKTCPVINAAGYRAGGYTARFGIGAAGGQIFNDEQA